MRSSGSKHGCLKNDKGTHRSVFIFENTILRNNNKGWLGSSKQVRGDVELNKENIEEQAFEQVSDRHERRENDQSGKILTNLVTLEDSRANANCHHLPNFFSIQRNQTRVRHSYRIYLQIKRKHTFNITTITTTIRIRG